MRADPKKEALILENYRKEDRPMTTDPKSGTPRVEALDRSFRERGWRAYGTATYLKMMELAEEMERELSDCRAELEQYTSLYGTRIGRDAKRLAAHAEREGTGLEPKVVAELTVKEVAKYVEGVGYTGDVVALIRSFNPTTHHSFNTTLAELSRFVASLDPDVPLPQDREKAERLSAPSAASGLADRIEMAVKSDGNVGVHPRKIFAGLPEDWALVIAALRSHQAPVGEE